MSRQSADARITALEERLRALEGRVELIDRGTLSDGREIMDKFKSVYKALYRETRGHA